MSEDIEKAEGEGEGVGLKYSVVGGWVAAILTLLLVGWSLFLVVAGGGTPGMPALEYVVLHEAKANLNHVRDELVNYAERHDGTYPQRDWYEVLYDGNASDSWGLRANEGVVLNPEALKLGEDMPDSMVLGYIGKWGGTEKFDASNDQRHRVTFIGIMGDGEIKRISKSHAKYLQWEAEQAVAMPVVDRWTVWAIYSGLMLVVFLIVRRYKYCMKEARVGLIVNFWAAGLLGAFCIMLAKDLYLRFDAMGVDNGEYLLFLVGPLFALGYVPLMVHVRKNSFVFGNVCWIALFGVLAGVLCSTVVHILLRLFYLEDTYFGMIAGVPFGAVAGLLLGIMTAGMVRKSVSGNNKISVSDATFQSIKD